VDVQITGKGHPLVVALHGIQGTRTVWAPLAERLSGRATFVLPNLRGRGRAPRGDGIADYRLERFADDLAEVIRSHVGDRDYWLAGWSMGVSVALEYLGRQGVHLPRGVVLASGTPALRNVSWFMATEPVSLMREIGERERKLNLKEAADHVAVAQTWGAIRDTDQRGVLASIRCPALIVHGSADDQCPLECAHALADGIPGSTLKVLGGGHSLPVTHADVLSALFRDFLPKNPDREKT
jgi:pimeloyl-ACP methyl ester carboxylesterase